MNQESWCGAPISYCGDIHGKTCVHLVVRVIWIFLFVCDVCWLWLAWRDSEAKRERERKEEWEGGIMRSCAKPVLGHFFRVITLVAGAAVRGVWGVPFGRCSNPPGRTFPPPGGGEGGGARAVGMVPIADLRVVS